MTKVFVLLAIMSHSNGSAPDVFVVDNQLTWDDCKYAEEGLKPIMAEGIQLTCEEDHAIYSVGNQ